MQITHLAFDAAVATYEFHSARKADLSGSLTVSLTVCQTFHHLSLFSAPGEPIKMPLKLASLTLISVNIVCGMLHWFLSTTQRNSLLT